MVTIHLNRTEHDIFSGYSKLDTPDERKEHKVEGSLICEEFEELIKCYEKIVDASSLSYAYEMIPKIEAVLTPVQINSLLQSTLKYEEHWLYKQSTGLFITKLIENSYNSGHKKFHLNTALLKRIEHIGYSLKGRKDKLLEIVVEGDIGDHCFGFVDYLELKLIGDAGKSLGGAAQYSRFDVEGNVEESCGCDFPLYTGQTFFCGGMLISGSKSSVFNISGSLGESSGQRSENCVFKTSDKESINVLRNELPYGKANRIYYLKPDEKEERIWRLKDILHYGMW
ncbi:MAG: hypothetical protein ABIB71_03665 [Candidatus Woesearchaeota archaeon]